MFAEPSRAAELARLALPPALVAAIDWNSLVAVPTSFVDAELRDHEADLLFEIRVHERPALLYLLLEHKSHDERFTLFQLLRYVVRIWERQRREDPTALHLRPVLPIVFHHGPQGWRSPLRLRELVDLDGLPVELAELQPDLCAQLLDLADFSEARLLDATLSELARLSMLFLQHLRGAEPRSALAALARWSHLLRQPVGHEGLVVLLSYVFATVEVQPDAVRAAFASSPQPQPDTTMKTAAQYLIEEGRAEGRSAVAKTLRTVLERRFGPLDADLEARVVAADLDQLLDWMAKAALVTERAEVFRT